MKKTPRRTFSVGLAVRIWLDVDVVAETAEQALEQARALKVADVVEVSDRSNDHAIEVLGVFDSTALDRLGL